MNSLTTSAFDLPEHLAAKGDEALVGDDDRHFAAITASLERQIAELTERLVQARRRPGGKGQAAMDRDLEVHRLTDRLRTLSRFGLDLCLGRMVHAGSPDSPDSPDGPVYIGRLGLLDQAGRRLLLDWRSPAAEPFFGATHANPMGLASRRRYRWTLGRITDYWEEVFSTDGTGEAGTLEGHAALDDQSAFIASLGSSRSPRMRDVLGTIQADQDAIIRAGSRGALVVDGGPGTGKTVVALHRAAYLLYADPRLRQRRRGGVLVVGPHQPYLVYTADVLPSLGEEGVQTCTLRDLVPESPGVPGAVDGAEEPAALVERLKASARWVEAIDTAVRFYQEPPTATVTITTPWSDVRLTADDWAQAFDVAQVGTPHNEARDQVLEELLTILEEKFANVLVGDPDGDGYEEIPPEQLRAALLRDRGFRGAFARAWPLLDAPDIVADLWSVPAYLRRCAPWLSREEVGALRRADPRAWTNADLPLLDLARQRLGDPRSARRRRQQASAAAAERERMSHVVDSLLAAEDDYEGAATMLVGQDMRDALVDADAFTRTDPDLLAGPFAHIVVDEAQELTDVQWQMLLARCPSRSFTIVGDRAQARHGFTETWRERLARVGFDEVRLASLSINYRTPQEVMAQAEPVIRAALPDANVPTSIRASGLPVTRAAVSDLESILIDWLDGRSEGTACVIGTADFQPSERVRSLPRVQVLTPTLAKGLEFDLVILVDPETFGVGITGAVDRYVAMTRATRHLVLLSPSDLVRT
ncbi:AAA family ATPase [Frankia sp. AgPm24]|uniref:RNA polymerase recycling motor ATPase HelR n=1 Tax=Frankia sp. AgPm24 TaxID=631128 RepID=UPI00200D0A8F|nr:RNA polymerase recycling motor ATPase HelR [Frankia sp. AgPm24]MCK9921887.1 AAA family ATPase [Frankia sp. AgPm24]